MKNFFFWAIIVVLVSCKNTQSVKFAVCADVHQDLICDATDRIKTFVKAAEDEKSDFIIQSGDFCLPFEKNEPF